MKIPFAIGDKQFLLNPYCTSQEKDILIMSSFDVNDYDRIFDVLNFKYDGDLSDDEKKCLLYQFRAISLGDEIDIKFSCDHCKQGNDAVLEANDFIIDSPRSDPDIRKLNKKVTDANLHEFLINEHNLDELDILDFEALKIRAQQNQITFDFTKTAKCLKCGKPKTFDMSDLKYIIEIMSEDSLMSLYKSYNSLIYFGQYSKHDIDTMYPFERGIFISLLNQTKEDLSS